MWLFKVYNYCWVSPLWLLAAGRESPSYAFCYTPIGCTSKPVCLLCFHLLHGRNSKIHTRRTDGISVSHLHRRWQVSRGDLSRTGAVRPQSLGEFGNCHAVILRPLASVFGELGGKLGHVKKMKRHVKRQLITVKAWDVTKHYTRPRTDTLVRRPRCKWTWDSYRVLVGRP
jgi:hypothetical protein